jgi:hypothetical protein
LCVGVSLLFFSVLLSTSVEGQHKAQTPSHQHQPFRLPYSVAAFSGVVLPNFQGNDLQKIASGLAAGQHVRDPFETTVQYNARVLKEKSVPLAGGLAPDSVLAFVFPTEERLRTNFLGQFALDLQYDADHQVMTVFIDASPTKQESQEEPTELALRWIERTNSSSEYLASNGFGATATVSDEHKTDYALSVSAKSTMFGLYAPGEPEKPISLSFSVSPEKARSLNRRLRLLVVCSIANVGPVSQNETSHSPTIEIPLLSIRTTNYLHVLPREFWIFDIVTGEVLARAHPDGIVIDAPAVTPSI